MKKKIILASMLIVFLMLSMSLVASGIPKIKADGYCSDPDYPYGVLHIWMEPQSARYILHTTLVFFKWGDLAGNGFSVGDRGTVYSYCFYPDRFPTPRPILAKGTVEKIAGNSGMTYFIFVMIHGKHVHPIVFPGIPLVIN